MSFALARAAGNYIWRMLRYAGGCSGIVAMVDGDASGDTALGAGANSFPLAPRRSALDGPYRR